MQAAQKTEKKGKEQEVFLGVKGNAQVWVLESIAAPIDCLARSSGLALSAAPCLAALPSCRSCWA